MWKSLLSSLALAASVVHATPWGSVTTIPPTVVNKTSIAQFTSSSHGLDAPHVTPINASAWDWWYFDVISPDHLQSVVVVFYTAPETGFLFDEAPVTNINLASINVGIKGHETFFGSGMFANAAKVVSVSNGAAGRWEGSGFEFVGSPDLKEYEIKIDSPEIGVKGTITFHSVSSSNMHTYRYCARNVLCHALTDRLGLLILQIDRPRPLPMLSGQSGSDDGNHATHRVGQRYPWRCQLRRSQPQRDSCQILWCRISR